MLVYKKGFFHKIYMLLIIKKEKVIFLSQQVQDP